MLLSDFDCFYRRNSLLIRKFLAVLLNDFRTLGSWGFPRLCCIGYSLKFVFNYNIVGENYRGLLFLFELRKLLLLIAYTSPPYPAFSALYRSLACTNNNQ